MVRLNKAITFQRVIDTLTQLDDTFTVNDIHLLTGIRAEAIQRALKGLEELIIIKYIESNNIYIKINNTDKNQSYNIINSKLHILGGQTNDNS